MAQVMLRDYLQGIEDAIGAERVDDALNRCQRVLVQFPESLEVQRLLGEVYLRQGHVEDAQQSLDWVLTNDPENVIAYCDRALISERLSDFDTALDCYQQAYELSRGNTQIRHEFNVLSVKAGQQGFMFSRAGLARLYMRGGLLPQAVQEWDAVLAVSPERLDARTGLLEACWREGLYERAEQLANQILQDVPACLKALLILAHTTAPKDMQQARELIQRAETLDPDLIMAQELFEDMMASQPGHPFLKLLKKPPVVLEDSSGSSIPSVTLQPTSEASPIPAAPLYEEQPTNSLFSWSDLESWQGSSIQAQPTFDEQLVPEASAFSAASSDTWSIPQQRQEPEVQQDAFASASHQENPQFMPESQGFGEDTITASPQPGISEWSDVDQFAEPSQEHRDVWKSMPDEATARSADSYASYFQQEGASASPPSWLNMLTQEEQGTQQKQPSGTMPSLQSEQETAQEAAIEHPVESYQQQAEYAPSVFDEDNSWRNDLQASLDAADEDVSFFGPEWLKSLGAATMGDSQETPTQQAPIAEPELSEKSAATPAMPSHQTIESAFKNDVWSDYKDHPDHVDHPSSFDSLEPAEQNEQHLITTLEGLEQDLRSQGFVPLEPNSLSALAQEQPATYAEHSTPETVQQSEETYVREPSFDETTLSSALAQLGNFATSSASSAYEASTLHESPAQPMQTTPFIPEPTPQPTEPLWTQEIETTPILNESQREHQLSASPRYIDAPSSPTEPAPIAPGDVPQESSVVPPMPVVPVPSAPAASPMESKEAPAARIHTFDESELEATMKRPAIRLQPVQQRSAAQQASSATRGRGGDARPPVSKTQEETQHQERLKRGYQHQLVGDYDEAMQEYRFLIRSAPELLNEVVSNVRALLKLSPKYSAGYRVLGDAYMRQGEYLQAMEAYNKALSMAKKAKV